MMKNLGFLILLFILGIGCANPIKNEEAHLMIEEGVAIDSASQRADDIVQKEAPREKVLHSSTGDYWVGSFDPHNSISLRNKYISADEGLYWGRENKISISIDAIVGDSVMGHSVVAGNHRPFHGTMVTTMEGQKFQVREPGDHKYDGSFSFEISNNELKGTWEAFNEIDIPKREYSLSLRTFEYDPDIELEKSARYGNWEKFLEGEKITEVFDEGSPDEEVYEWVRREFATTTSKPFEINASNTLLTKEDVENLTNSDLVVIRNTIYARHGYSFKNRPLRVFFDQQDWYIPVNADITQDFSEIEKKNIQLLLRYEKNAKEYYDYFGRG